MSEELVLENEISSPSTQQMGIPTINPNSGSAFGTNASQNTPETESLAHYANQQLDRTLQESSIIPKDMKDATPANVRFISNTSHATSAMDTLETMSQGNQEFRTASMNESEDREILNKRYGLDHLNIEQLYGNLKREVSKIQSSNPEMPEEEAVNAAIHSFALDLRAAFDSYNDVNKMMPERLKALGQQAAEKQRNSKFDSQQFNVNRRDG